MNWSFSLGRVAGVDVRVHVTFLLLLLWFAAGFYGLGGLPGLTRGLAYIGSLFGLVLLHEFGHALVARRYGIETPTITLLPIGGVARLERMPERPGQELAVAVAGPAVNLALAALLAAWLVPAGRLPGFGGFDGLGEYLGVRLFWANLFLAGFNLLPAFPMDGGRILRALLATRLGFARATQTAASVGQAMAFVFGFLGLVGNPILLFIALFVYLGATGEASVARLQEAADGIPVAEAMETDFQSLQPHTTLREAARRLLHTAQRAFPVVDESGRLVGLLTREDALRQLAEGGGPETPVADAAHRDPPAVRPNDMLHNALQVMARQGVPTLAVVRPDGTVAGILSRERVGELVMIYGALRRGGRARAAHQPPGPAPQEA